jgi:cell division protein FtsB
VKERTGRGIGWMLGLIALLALAVVVAGIFPFRQILAQRSAVDLAEERLAAIEDENLLLEARITALQTPEEVERLAREWFGLVRPGETGYVVVTPPGESIPDPEPSEPVTGDRPWYQRLWDFFTGRDLVEDG